MGRALSRRRGRQLAVEPEGSDITVRDRSSGLDRKGTASLDHEGAGQKQSRRRHGQTRLTTTRNAVPWVLMDTPIIGVAPDFGAMASPRA